ncbi:hypothetical protein OG900_26105 [Streptomyces sp. NBC_00433]
MRSIGVASVAAALALGVAGNAFACKIGDFSAVANCDKTNGKATIDVTDADSSGTPATVTILDNGVQVASGTIDHPTADGVTVSIPLAWAPSKTYTVHVTAGQPGKKVLVDEDIKGGVTTPSEACTAPVDNPPPPVDNPPPADNPPPKDTKSPTPTATTTAPAAAVADTNAPSPAGGTSNLAETGGGSNTGMIAGVAAVLVAAGGGTVFMLRRRNPAGRH